MNTPPFFAVQKQTLNGVSTILAVEYTLDPADIDPTTDLHLYVDTLTLPGQTFSLPGKNIVITARQINCASGAAFDSSGKSYDQPVVPINPPKAASGSASNKGGVDGASGGVASGAVASKGDSAGNITIIAASINGQLSLSAKGGNGQQGQNGQAGGDGLAGDNGNDAIINRVQHDPRHPDGWSVTQATPGGNGGRAGNGGNAGASGNGGDGGLVTVHTMTALATGQVTVANTGGNPGAASIPGKCGGFGAAGIGGRIAVEHEQGGHFNTKVWELSDDREGGAQDGTAGTDGKAATPAVKGKDAATDLSQQPIITKLFTPDLTTVNLVQLTLDYAEVAYLGNNLAQALNYYQWLEQLTSGDSGDAGLNTELAGLNQRCKILQKQIGQGLDYFSNPINYVPIVTLDLYTQMLDGMLSTGGQVESTYNQYTAYLNGQSHEFDGMNDAIANAQTAITNYVQAQKDYYTKINATGATIIQLTNALVAQHNVLTAADESFKKAVEAKGQSCSFASFLALLKTILTVGVDVYSAFSDPTARTVSTAVKDFADIGIGIENGNLVTNPVPSKADPASISKIWEQISTGGSDVDDSSKLIAEQNDFDKSLQPYLDMPEAQNYKKQVHDYIGITQSRNSKLLEYTNDCIQYIALTGLINQKQAEVNRIKAQIAKENVPGLISYRNFLFTQYQDYKRLCLKYLYQENRAYDYWSQQDNPFTISDNSFVGLGIFHNNLKAQIINSINNYSQPSQPLTNIEILLDPATRPEQFASFQQNGLFNFQITLDENSFLGWSNVLLTNFKIYIQGVTAPAGGNVYVQFLHQGRVVLIDQHGAATNYTHNQVLSVYEYTLQNGQPVTIAGGSLGGDGTGGNQKRIALSPYASFGITLPAKFNPGVDFSKATGIEIHFSGYAVPRLNMKVHG